MLLQRHQCSPAIILEQGCSHQRHQCSPTTILEQGCSNQGYQCSQSTTLEQGCSVQRHQCSISSTIGQGCPKQRHQCSPPITLGQGCSNQRPQCSISIDLLILLNCNWMTPNVVPTRSTHHRFLILRNPSNLAMYSCLWCRDKNTWRQPIVYIIETGITVFEVN